MGNLMNKPLLGHHQETLNQQSLQNLRTDALEERHRSLMLYNILHDFRESLKGLPIPRWWRLRLQPNFSYNQRLRRNRR